jgi:DNA mismatch repair protein MutL
VTLQSRAVGQERGAEVRCQGGRVSPVQVWNGSPGTRVEVRHLFYNTPVRRKFLRGPATEMGHVCEVFARMALSQLALHLTLRHNGRVVHDVPASAGLLDRVGLFFGPEVAARLYMVEASQGHLTLGGYVADPACERGSTQTQFFFVNGRWVRDRVLSQALQEAYRGLVMTGRHPVAFLFLEVEQGQVDVNVHPTKAEVRFRQPEKVQALVEEAVRARLRKQDLTPPLRPPAAREPDPAPALALPFPPPAPPRSPAPPSPAPVAEAPPPAPLVLRAAEQRTAPPPEVKKHPAPPAPPPCPRPLKAVQMHDLYLVVEVPEGVLVIDQHALHERVLFEEMKARLGEGRLSAQRLLVPEPVSLSPAEAARLLEHAEALAELGLEVSDFGGGTVLLRGYPAALGKRAPREVLRAVVDYLGSKERLPAREVLLNELLSLLACHAAVRAGDRLTPDEVAALVARRELAEDSHHCPHGRPTSLLFTRHELDRQFRRG